MSRLWSERLQLLIAPDQVLLVKERRGFRGFRPVHVLSEAVSQDLTVLAGVVEALRVVLERSDGLKEAQAKVLVSSGFVRYALVADADKLRDENERMLAAQHALKATFGSEVVNWKMTLSQGVGSDTEVAAGMDESFFDAILTTLGRAGVQVTGVEPLLVDVLRKLDPPSRRGKDRDWAVVVERTQILLVMHHEGHIRLIRTQRRRGDLIEQVIAMLDQSCLQNGIDRIGGSVWMFPLTADDVAEGIAFPPESKWHLGAVSVFGPFQPKP